MAPHSSTLAWKIPWMEEPGRLQSMGSLRVGHNWATSLSLFTFMHWRRKWQATPVFLPGELHVYIGKILEDWVTCWNGWNPHLNYHLQLKTKEDVGGSGLGLQRAGRQFMWRWKSKCLINKCLLGCSETMGHRVDLNSRPCWSFSLHVLHLLFANISADHSVPEMSLLCKVFI